VVLKYVNFAPFSKDLLAIFYDSALHFGDETSTYALFSLRLLQDQAPL
jgi:hypothetical protein